MGMVSIASSRAGPEMATWETHNTGDQGGWGQNMTINTYIAMKFLHQSKDTGYTCIGYIAPGNITNAQCNNTLPVR